MYKKYNYLIQMYIIHYNYIHSQIKYMACIMDKNQDIKLPECYIWLSQNQLIDLIHKQKIDIEARLLFGIINFKETI